MLSTLRPIRHPRRAFTMIELLVTIGIILVLMGIVLVAVRRLGTTSKEHATHITLANLQGMLNDYGAATGFKTEPTDWVLDDYSEGTVVIVATVPPSTTSFWTAPSYAGTPLVAQPVVAPENVSDSGSINVRMGSPAVLNTLVAMNMICRIPANRTAVANMPPQGLLVPTFVTGQAPKPGSTGWMETGDSNGMIAYPVGCHVQFNGKYYVSLLKNSDSTPVSSNNWRDESAAPQQAPLLLDGWGNPIIFVPASGLKVLLMNGGTTYDSTNTNLKLQTVTAPDHRPFWASAGPDGDFTRGDDNLYSFEQ